MRAYSFVEEPRGDGYRALVHFIADSGATAGLVLREHRNSVNASAADLLDALAPFVVRDERVASWPGTQLAAHTARLVRFALTPETAGILRERAEGLYGWLQPDLPEDLCAWRGDGSLLLASIAHERDGWLELEPVEFDSLSKSLDLRPDDS